jgi:hypothetical protein
LSPIMMLLLRSHNVMLLSGRPYGGICGTGYCVLNLASGCGTIDVKQRGSDRILVGRFFGKVEAI